MAAADFNGKFKLEKTDDNLDALLKAIGVGSVQRAALAKASPTVEITQNGDNFTIKSKTALRSQETTFTMGQEFTAKAPFLDKEATMMPSWEGSKMVIKNVSDADGLVITREIEGGKLIMTIAKGGVVCKRTFARC